jgi:hypothetical protein
MIKINLAVLCTARFISKQTKFLIYGTWIIVVAVAGSVLLAGVVRME